MRWYVVAFCLACAVDAQAQRILYDAKRDAAAQQAVATANEVTSGSLFDTMLRNVDAQAKLEVDSTIAGVEQRMRAQIQSWKVWHSPLATLPSPNPALPLELKLAGLAAVDCHNSLRCTLEVLERRLTLLMEAPDITPEQIKARLDAIKVKSGELQEAVRKLQEQLAQEQSKANDPGVLRALAALEDPGKDILEYAMKIAKFAEDRTQLKGATKALDAIGEGLDQLILVYHTVRDIWVGQKAVSVDPASLRPLQEQLDLRLLAVETDYLKARARIEARRYLEVNAALNQVQTGLEKLRRQPTVNEKGEPEKTFLIDSTEEIETTLRNATRDAKRDRLTGLLQVLHDTAAAVAQMDAAGVLAQFRTDDERRRNSIRISTVNASTYDSTIQAAVGRLALYWKAGVKPADLAQLAFYLTNTVAIPAIAFKE
jgi:hypothetical protein